MGYPHCFCTSDPYGYKEEGESINLTKEEIKNDGMEEQETLCHDCDKPIPTYEYRCDTCQEGVRV